MEKVLDGALDRKRDRARAEEENEAGQKITEFCQENVLISKNSSNNTKDDSTHEYNQIVNTKIRLIIFFIAKDGEALYSQQK